MLGVCFIYLLMNKIYLQTVIALQKTTGSWNLEIELDQISKNIAKGVFLSYVRDVPNIF